MSPPRPKKPFVHSLPFDSTRYTALLKPPKSNQLKSGFVSLAPKEEVGSHSTENCEELLIILSGVGEMVINGQDKMKLAANQIAYVPPETEHNVENVGNEPLRYIYVVSKVTN